MKRINKNIFVFIICFVLIGIGCISTNFFYFLLGECSIFKNNIKNGNIVGGVSDLIYNLDANTSKNLSYHNQCIELNGLFNNITNKKIIKSNFVKTDNGYLCTLESYCSNEKLSENVLNLKNLYNETLKNNANFLYVAAPPKGYDLVFPSNTKNFTKSNFDRFICKLDEQGVPYLNLVEEMHKDNISVEDMFFVTDHHWKPKSGLWACEKILNKLNEDYDIDFDEKYNDINNYNVKTYKNWFLGTSGKKTGSMFTFWGADDIDLITPKFYTQFIEEQPIKSEVRKGDFSDPLLFLDNINDKDYYHKCPYATYSGGDFRLQIFTNEMNTTGETYLLIRDSFACVTAPFLALNASKVYIVDIRNFENFVGDKINVYQYIREIKPDNVLVLYSDVRGESDEFKFK